MKKLILDSNDTIIYEGVDVTEVFRVLTAHPSEVTEEDEITYGEILRNTKWVGKLRKEVHFNLRFVGIDDWNRAVFKNIDSELYFGDTNKLWTYKELGEDNKLVNEYYKNNTNSLIYFGSEFNCEPNGGKADCWKFFIVE
ncbi:hypothetical protein DSECCO2_119960 [anaerobic digester metagenome]